MMRCVVVFLRSLVFGLTTDVTLPLAGGSDAAAAGEGKLFRNAIVSSRERHSALSGPESPTLPEGE